MKIFIIIFSVIIVCIAIILINCITRKKYKNFILKNSLCLKQLNEINSRYSFYPYIDFNQYYTYDNEKYYNNISCTDYLIYQLQFIGKKVSDQIHNINFNKRQYSNYLSETKAITQFGEYQASAEKLKVGKLIKLEKIIFNKKIYQSPVTQFALTVTLYCSKINGQVYHKKFKNFTAEDIWALISRLKQRRGTFYLDRGIWDAICRVERGKVSNKMRFSIYARDNYRCCKCGVSNRYAQLEIDHIIPIAKGGKTTYDNLQTLCHNCNVEKGDSLY